MGRLVVLLLVLFIDGMTAAEVSESTKYKFTQLKCEVYDQKYGVFSLCKISFYQRQLDAMSLTFHLTWNVSKGLTVKYQLLKKETGWHPFLYAGELDVCDFLRNRRKYYLVNLYYTYVQNYTNINHKCPFTDGETISINALKINAASILAKFPFEIGEYAVDTFYYFNKKRVARIFGSLEYTDYRSG